MLEIWRECGLSLSTSDTHAELKRFIEFNPDTCLLCEIEGEIIGSVFGGFDGRRGLVHHLAVKPNHRRKGYGRLLMQELDLRFRQKGVLKYHLWIEDNDDTLISFYEDLGFELRSLITMSRITE